jgi:hypothetical protein
MPSFFEGLKRVIQGKPVFDPNDTAQPAKEPDPFAPTNPLAEFDKPETPPPAAPAQVASSQPTSTIQKNNPSSFPVVSIDRTHISRNGQVIEVYCTIRNNWHDELLLDNLRLLNTSHKLNVLLHPGNTHEVQVYHGAPFAQQPPTQATIDYKTHEGDYFEALFDVHFTFTSDKTYEVTELRLRPPIRDIYG